MTMKKITLLMIAIALTTLFSCKKINNKTMTVVKDCTGVYLRFNRKDYLVCNLEKVSAFADGAKVKASFEKIKGCSDIGQQAFVCMMIHENKGWINVKKIE